MALANREITTSEFNRLSSDLIGRFRKERRRTVERRFFAIAMVPPVVVCASAYVASAPGILAAAAITVAGWLGRRLARSILDRRYPR